MERQAARSTRTLQLAPSGVAAVTVRATLRELMTGSPFADRLDDALLATTELVSNAVLHGREPIVVTVDLDERFVRVAVRDRSAVSPSFSLLDPTAVTGRGLLLVSSVADSWGVEPEVDGKTVWMRIDGVPQTRAERADVDILLASWGDELLEDPALERVRVVLTDVDVALASRSEAHVEGLLRELSLVAGSDGADPGLLRTATTVVRAASRFEHMRSDLKRQLAAAMSRGRATADIELTITRSDAELVRDYAHGLDDAERLSAAGRLLHEPDPVAADARRALLHRILSQLSS